MSKKCRAYSLWQGESVGRYGTLHREAFYAGWDAALAELDKMQEPVARAIPQPDLVAEFSNLERQLLAESNEIEQLKSELETERLRLAACGVAALGYFDGCKNEYKSASLDDTLRLYASNTELRQQLSAAQAREGELLKAMEECRFALEPYDDVKPRNWETDRARLRYAHQSASKAIAAHKARQLPQIDFTGVCVDENQLEEAVRDMKKMMGIDNNKEK